MKRGAATTLGGAILSAALLAFAARTCYEFRDVRWQLPSVAVHGDAHPEQFVVTDASFGLADFDRAGFGPAIVDLVRYAASVHLACREDPRDRPHLGHREVGHWTAAERGTGLTHVGS